MIYSAAADGTGVPTQFAKATGIEPSVSPDGKYLAVQTLSGYPYVIAIYRTDGSGAYELVKNADLGPDLSWSPDSTKVTYVDDEEPSGGNNAIDQIWVAPADRSSEGNAVPMPPGWIVPHNPVFSPDGTRVAFDARMSTGPGYEQILVGPADGSAPAVPITEGELQDQEPAWKPGPGGPKSVPPPPGDVIKTKPPHTFRLAVLKHVKIVNGFLRAVGIDCDAQGGHPTGKVAEICAARGEATYLQTRTEGRAWARQKGKPRKIAFAKGHVNVPEGKTKTLPLKLTGAGKKLLKPGRKLKLTVSVTVTRTSGKQTIARTVTLKVPNKR